MSAYYNEIDPKKVAALRELIKQGLIAPGEVDDRSIEDVRPDELLGFTQCHFFAGVGIWSYALRLAGWPDDREVWTGSCPCPSFSTAGKGEGFDDARHLWPVWFNLIRECRPSVIFGEQVEAAVNHGWLDLVQSDLERENYACGAVGFPACGIGAPHIRQRLWFVAERLDQGAAGGKDRAPIARRLPSGGSTIGLADCENKRPVRREIRDEDGPQRQNALRGKDQGLRQSSFASDSIAGGLADDSGAELAKLFSHRGISSEAIRASKRQNVTRIGTATIGGVADDDCSGQQPRPKREFYDAEHNAQSCGEIDRPGPTNGFWRDVDWLGCRDGKWRPVEPGTFPLAHGAPERVGRLSCYGDGIVAQVAQAFIEAYMSVGDPE